MPHPLPTGLMFDVPPALRALLLDLDGTLIDRAGALRSWLRRRAGLGAAELQTLARLDAEETGELALVAAELSRMRPGLARGTVELAARIRDELPAELRPDPTITTALQQARTAGLRLALVSNGGSTTQRRKLAQAKLGPELFEVLLISGEVGCAKPDPAIFELALARLGVPREAALMVGDSPAHDIVGARAAGIASCWISRGRGWSDTPGAVRPDMIAESLPALLERLGSGSMRSASW